MGMSESNLRLFSSRFGTGLGPFVFDHEQEHEHELIFKQFVPTVTARISHAVLFRANRLGKVFGNRDHRAEHPRADRALRVPT